MVTLAASPGGFERTAVAEQARVDPDGLGVDAGGLLVAAPDRVRVDLGPDARLDARLADRRDWPRRAWGALGPAHAVPGLGQYWSPHLLAARVTGSATCGDRRRVLDGASVYAEKNWGGAFAEHWWWGQAGFEDGSGVAFAGGRLARLGAPTAVAAWTRGGLTALAPPLARAVASAGGGEWRVRARSVRWRVEIEGEAAGPPLRLPVPIPGERRLEVRSSHHLVGRLRATVWRGRRVWLRGSSSVAALEDGRPDSGRTSGR